MGIKCSDRIVCTCALIVMTLTVEGNPFPSGAGSLLLNELNFTRDVYNVTIPENSIGKTYVTSTEKIGMYCRRKCAVRVTYKIVAGDSEKFFKAEERLVGNFWFLLIRIRAGKTAFLNRERKEIYTLHIKGILYNNTKSSNSNVNANESLSEIKTTVNVRILDVNDLSPLFYPTDYKVTVNEDAPLYSSVAKVSAEDADLGVNGEIYYWFSKGTDMFAVHPLSLIHI